MKPRTRALEGADKQTGGRASCAFWPGFRMTNFKLCDVERRALIRERGGGRPVMVSPVPTGRNGRHAMRIDCEAAGGAAGENGNRGTADGIGKWSFV
ncbi:MAG: hypothetical protein Q8M03_07075 [Legionella sp.]|nr:hypothetical protein [Legionella sp.]